MFSIRRKKEKQSVLDKPIIDLAMEMENGYSDELVQQAQAMKLMLEAKATEQKPKVSNEALVSAGASLAGILMILLFESKNVITNKNALSFVNKPRA